VVRYKVKGRTKVKVQGRLKVMTQHAASSKPQGSGV
jgi:hypothetical protein